jgi:hypothetical protein
MLPPHPLPFPRWGEGKGEGGGESCREDRVLNRQGENRRVFKDLTRYFEKRKDLAKSPGELALKIGRFFLGNPYVGGLFETRRAEHLVINLEEFDCVTFVETVVALSWHILSREKSFEAFQGLLRKMRYRQGRLQGYPSRLHYFSDWIHDNEKKGLLRDVTGEIGGRPFRKALNFMTTNPNLYPQLKNGATLRRMKSVERKISKKSLFIIPKRSLRLLEDRICDGDLIAITTNTEGLDVQHVGFAARVKNRIHLLHASSTEGKVVLSKETLYLYLMKNKTRSGIMVARVTMMLDA